MARKLVMGAAVGFRADQVIPFVTSLRNTGYSGSIVLFVDSRLGRALHSHSAVSDVTLIRAQQWPAFKQLLDHKTMMRFLWFPLRKVLWMLLRALRRLPIDEEVRCRLQLPLALLMHTPMDGRFLRFYRFVKMHPHEFVLLSDVRDVLFQNDPFTHLPDTGLAVSIETRSYSIATESHNAEWVRRVYGQPMLAEIGANRVSCVGVTFGDGPAISNYLKLMTDEMLRMSPKRAGIGGADTAIHNMLIWTNRLGRVHLLEPLASAVATLNGIDEARIRLGPGSKLLNVDGSEASVLHQYDRVPGLRRKLLRTLSA